jgi:hypothetical protein
MASCKSKGFNVEEHFVAIDTPSVGGNGAVQYVRDYRLTRYACYLVAISGDGNERLALRRSLARNFNSSVVACRATSRARRPSTPGILVDLGVGKNPASMARRKGWPPRPFAGGFPRDPRRLNQS